MLTPSELLDGFSQNYFPGSRVENPSNVDIHIHTYNHTPLSTQISNSAAENNISHSIL